MAQLVRIGNSQGVRIPKSLIEQAHLEGKKLKFQLVSGGLLIAPELQAREGWKEQIAHALNSNVQESEKNDWLDFSLDADDELEW
jgi:antitoxin MazE